MKNLPRIVTGVVCASLMSMVLAQPIQAQQTNEQNQQGSQPVQKQLQDVQARQLAMKAEMDLIKKTNDLGERQRLLDEHLRVMMTQVQAMAAISKMSGTMMDPGSREAMLEQRTQLITSLMDQLIAHYEMQLTCSR